MDFNEFVLQLKRLKEENGYTVRIIEERCPRFSTGEHAHLHLCLRLKAPRKWMLLTPIEAVLFYLYRDSRADEKLLRYEDPNISLNGIKMASEYIDWLECG